MAKQYITYEPIDWAQGVSGGTPLNASNLNRMENAIEELVEKANAPITIDDIGESAVGNTQIAPDSVTSDKLAQTVRDSLSRLSFTEGKRLYVGTKPSNNYTEIKVTGNDDTVTQIYADGSCLCYRKLVNGSWTTIGRIPWVA